jgi:hypothetical protein
VGSGKNRADPAPLTRKVFLFGEKDYAWLNAVLAKASPSNPAWEQRVIELLAKFPPDEAALVAFNIAREFAARGGLRP